MERVQTATWTITISLREVVNFRPDNVKDSSNKKRLPPSFQMHSRTPLIHSKKLDCKVRVPTGRVQSPVQPPLPGYAKEVYRIDRFALGISVVCDGATVDPYHGHRVSGDPCKPNGRSKYHQKKAPTPVAVVLVGIHVPAVESRHTGESVMWRRTSWTKAMWKGKPSFTGRDTLSEIAVDAAEDPLR
jgi:hypothetical protein